MSHLPSPLVPANCSLSDFAFMPLDVRRLLTSETWVLATGEERAAAMCLWLESWHQIPAGSLPDNDRMLAHLAQCPNWSNVKEQALRGWVKCSDGRLYHKVVAEKALEAWIEKLLAAIAGAIGNAKRWGVDMDIDALRVELSESADLLQSIAPQSRALRKPQLHKNLSKVCTPSDEDSEDVGADLSPPDRPPIAPRITPDSPPDRNRQGQGQGHRQGEEKSRGARATRLPADWSPSPDQIRFCQLERPDLEVSQTALRFRDYWIAQAGQKGVKADWDATWRNWVRNERQRQQPYQTAADKRQSFAEALTGRNRERTSLDIIDLN